MLASELKQVDGSYPTFAWPGGYPMVYFDKCGNTICSECANRDIDDSQAVIGGDIYYEGPNLQCDDCQSLIESAYGNPEDK